MFPSMLSIATAKIVTYIINVPIDSTRELMELLIFVFVF